MPVAASKEDRLTSFKNKGKDAEELRRRRVEVSVDLRKAKKDEMLTKRRNVQVSDEESDTGYSPLKDQTNRQPSLTVEEIKTGIFSTDFKEAFKATQAARKILSRERNPPIDVLIDAGIVPKLVAFLSVSSPDQSETNTMLFEAAWALTNIASGNSMQTRVVVEAGAVPHFIRLLEYPDLNVSEQAVWALGNIAGDGSELRDLVTNLGIIKPLIGLVKIGTSDAFLRNVVWTISNLCRNKNPAPKPDVINQVLPTLNKLMATHEDTEVLADACWALSYLTDGTNERIQVVVDAGTVPNLVKMLASSEISIVTPALRALGNVVTGSDNQTNSVIQHGGLPVICSLLSHSKTNVVKEAAWTISNITAGPQEQIQAVIENNCLPPLIEVLTHGDFKSKKESAWAITNLTSGGSLEQIVYLCSTGVLKPFCDLLDLNDEKAVCVVMDGLMNILSTATQQGEGDKVCELIEECGGLDKIEDLQSHENESVYKKALSIITTFFGEEEGAEETNGQEFAFAQPSATSAATEGGFNF
jgi:importin subunit alpha-2